MRKTRDLGKSLSLVIENDNMVIEALAKGLKTKNDALNQVEEGVDVNLR